MTSTSSEPAVLRDPQAGAVVLRDLPAGTVDPAGAGADLRSGRWTRLGRGGVLGDAAAEAALADLAERSRDAARAEGYAVGWAEGRRLAMADVAAAEAERTLRREAEDHLMTEAQQASANALAAAAELLGEALTSLCDEVSGQAVELALQIAEAVIGRELAVSEDPGGDALRRAVTQVPPDVAVTVRLHPADRAVLAPSVLDAWEGRRLRLVDDASLRSGDAVVETETGIVDATVAAALARVREVLQP